MKSAEYRQTVEGAVETLTDDDGNEIQIRYFPYSAGSDYSGEAVTRVNYEYLKNKFKDSDAFVDIWGGYSTYAFAYIPHALSDDERQEVNEILERLEDYPCLDDDALSAFETEELAEAFKEDYSRELKKYGNEHDEIPEAIVEAAESIMFDHQGDYAFLETGCIVYINWEKIRADLAPMFPLDIPVYSNSDFTVTYSYNGQHSYSINSGDIVIKPKVAYDRYLEFDVFFADSEYILAGLPRDIVDCISDHFLARIAERQAA